ncbi:MAG TPA: DUF5681 domain-containing protein [Chthoniobacterales bacterium]|jgi:hypothetical protein|nr:DUF5681 domain-containing protein [Chthoniobacterales bacterium]
MKLKIKTSIPAQNATELAKLKPGKGGIVPPPEHRFKPGAEWRGNKGGRPRAVRDLYQRLAAEKVKMKVQREDGRKEEIIVSKMEKVARTQFDIACKMEPHSVTAAREIARIVEPIDEQPTDRDNFDVAREVLILMMERAKHMEVKDII